jgi:Fe-S-cluster containining protein
MRQEIYPHKQKGVFLVERYPKIAGQIQRISYVQHKKMENPAIFGQTYHYYTNDFARWCSFINRGVCKIQPPRLTPRINGGEHFY